jgi:SRSO17 transposase
LWCCKKAGTLYKKRKSFPLKKKQHKDEKKIKVAKGHRGRLEKFLEHFESHFKIPNCKAFEIFNAFIRGLYLTIKSNCDYIARELEYNSQCINHFISNSPWQWKNVPATIGELFVKILPSSSLKDLCLVIDDSSHAKKGNCSIGAAHLYCGQLGKNANCQVGVYTALVCNGFYCLLQALLYLPKSWCKDKRDKIPITRREHLTKIDIAYSQIEETISLSHWGFHLNG